MLTKMTSKMNFQKYVDENLNKLCIQMSFKKNNTALLLRYRW